MLINPKEAIEQGWIKISGEFKWDECIQPNAIDFTLDKAHYDGRLNVSTIIGKNHKQLPSFEEMDTVYDHDTACNYFEIQPGQAIDGSSNMYVTLPSGVAAMLVVRSTLNRGNCTLTSGLYDSGYQGNIGFSIFNRGKVSAYIEKGARVGQIMFIPSDHAKLYAGGYNHNDGEHWSTSK